MNHATSALAALVSCTFGAWQPQAPPVRTTSTGVVMDVTVLDKDGRAVSDLTADDFEIREDGKAQQMISAALIRGGVATPLLPVAGAAAVPPGVDAGNATARTAPPAQPTPAVVAILFESISGDNRDYAARAAAQLVGTLTPPNEYAGVFLGGLAFTTVQPFTNRAEELRAALARVATTAANDMSLDREHSRTSSRIAGLDPSTPVTAGAEYGRGYTMTIAERERLLHSPDPDSMLRLMEYQMEEGYKRMLTELGGDAALASLRAAVDGLATLPGRKSLLYFTEALPITDRLKAHFDALIGAANRADITVYAVDANGLRVNSKEIETAQNANLAGAQGMGYATRESGAWTKDLEKQSEILSLRPAAALGRLANETGGFLIDNTNDLGKGVARMQVERTTYYLLGYQPANATLDGKFRRVTVKVRRGKYVVRARPGYVAASR